MNSKHLLLEVKLLVYYVIIIASYVVITHFKIILEYSSYMSLKYYKIKAFKYIRECRVEN
ncbi:MAG: hypothetical protein QXE99_02410 [Acidilobaceae archaeon]